MLSYTPPKSRLNFEIFSRTAANVVILTSTGRLSHFIDGGTRLGDCNKELEQVSKGDTTCGRYRVPP